ncbi:MAG: FkbM family methyltransferase, partial [Rhizobiales bacterium]|nr:FkbM family methyltransferase [Hyphomicrobiales bacterium]
MLDDFIARCRREARAIYLGEGRIACRALGRYDLIVDADDIGITPNIVCDGFWEPGISVLLERLLKPGMTAVDIGANVGYFSLLMASRVGANGRVVSIEANPAMAGLLRETVEMNGLEECVTVHNVAAADRAGELDFYIIPDRNLNGCILLDEWRERVDPARLSRVRAAA